MVSGFFRAKLSLSLALSFRMHGKARKGELYDVVAWYAENEIRDTLRCPFTRRDSISLACILTVLSLRAERWPVIVFARVRSHSSTVLSCSGVNRSSSFDFACVTFVPHNFLSLSLAVSLVYCGTIKTTRSICHTRSRARLRLNRTYLFRAAFSSSSARGQQRKATPRRVIIRVDT